MDKGYFKRVLLLSGVLFLSILISGVLSTSGVTVDAKGNQFKILHIMSYHSPWEWTDTMLSGFKDGMKNVDVDYKVYQMNTKLNSTEEAKDRMGREARSLIESWKPDLVYVTDDDACKYVAKYYVNSDLPFVFAAVNADPKDYGFTGSKNVTGVMEIEHFVETVKLLKQVDPTVRRIAVVIDDAPMWGPVVQRMKAKLNQFPELSFAIWDKIYTWADYKQKIQSYQTSVDAIGLLGIFGYKDENGKNVPYQEVQKWTAENSKVPDFSYWKDRASYGTLCVVSVSGYEQGLAAGKMARQILVDGKSPSSIKMTATTKGEPIISLARANKIGLKIKSRVLLTAKVFKQFIWEE